MVERGRCCNLGGGENRVAKVVCRRLLVVGPTLAVLIGCFSGIVRCLWFRYGVRLSPYRYVWVQIVCVLRFYLPCMIVEE